MYKYLDSIGKDCIIVNHSPIPEVYNFLNEDNIFQELDGDSASFIKKADLGLILDIGDFYRLGDVAFLVEENDIETLSIDHHAKSDNDLFKNEYIDVKASSVGEILYSFLKRLIKKFQKK